MRTAIFAYVDQGGEGLDPLVKEAILHLKNPGAEEHRETNARTI